MKNRERKQVQLRRKAIQKARENQTCPKCGKLGYSSETVATDVAARMGGHRVYRCEGLWHTSSHAKHLSQPGDPRGD